MLSPTEPASVRKSIPQVDFELDDLDADEEKYLDFYRQVAVREDMLVPLAEHHTPNGAHSWSVNCTFSGSLSGDEVNTREPELRDLYRELIEGKANVPRVGSVVELETVHPRYAVLDAFGVVVEPVASYLRELALDDNRPLTSRSYAYDMLRWHRLLWFLGVAWEQATEAEASALVGWLRAAENPQRGRKNRDAPPPGSVNLRTGKRYLKAGYAPTTINHNLTVVSSFYAFHRHHNRGPLVNPVPESRAQRQVLAHRTPDAIMPVFRRARLRQRVRQTDPRAIPDGVPLCGVGDLRG
ncbi:hypothetical protein ACIPPR_24960 [Streptomyces nigra]|uniref:hypothetical protein n=1 Tax=Streptomyces nigra TaxID=1827580 RepID=UPI0037FBF9E3